MVYFKMSNSDLQECVEWYDSLANFARSSFACSMVRGVLPAINSAKASKLLGGVGVLDLFEFERLRLRLEVRGGIVTMDDYLQVRGERTEVREWVIRGGDSEGTCTRTTCLFKFMICE